MKFFLDNNLSPKLAKGMKAFGEDVRHLQEMFDPKTSDVDWLEEIGKQRMFLITRDERIRWNPAEKDAIRRYSVGAFYLGGKNLNRCQLIRQLVRNWTRIKEVAKKESPPFGYRIPPRGTKFSKIDKP